MRTKQLFLALAVLFAGITSANAQQINWGIKAGVNYSDISSETDTDHILGFHAGLVTEFPLAAQFSLQPELVYSLEGTQSEFDFSEEGFNFSSDQKIRLGYINLPVMAKFFATPGFSFQAGPQLGYLVYAENEYKMSSNFPEDFTESGTEDIRNQLRKFSFGLNMGLGYEFQNRLFMQARYHIGLSDINNYDEEEEDLEMEKIKNKGFQLSLGFKF